jgi:thiamine-phosphate pyrophosphorylase
MNDRPDLARLAEADGVHVGQDELPVKEARRIVGPDALIGVSTHNLEQVRQAVLDGASYIGVGPTFPSGTKHFEEFPGLDFVRQATTETSLPAFVIGGVTLENVGTAVAAGARRVAVSQAICKADDPRRAAAEFLQSIVP